MRCEEKQLSSRLVFTLNGQTQISLHICFDIIPDLNKIALMTCMTPDLKYEVWLLNNMTDAVIQLNKNLHFNDFSLKYIPLLQLYTPAYCSLCSPTDQSRAAGLFLLVVIKRLHFCNRPEIITELDFEENKNLCVARLVL